MKKNICRLGLATVFLCGFIVASDNEKGKEASCCVSPDCLTEVGHSLKDYVTKSRFNKFKQKIETRFPELEETTVFGLAYRSIPYNFGIISSFHLVHSLNPFFFKTLAGHCAPLVASVPCYMPKVCSIGINYVTMNPYLLPIAGALVCVKLMYDTIKKKQIFPNVLNVCKATAYTGLALTASATLLSYGKR